MKTALLSLLAAAALTGTASAAPVVITTEAVPTRHVRTADLNLASEAGRSVAVRRISAAAEDVCDVAGDRSLKTALSVRRCYSGALKGGLAQLSELIAARPGAATAATATVSVGGR